MLLTAAAVVATSCVDDSKLLFSVDKPASIADMEYLNAYDVLKAYVNSSANPDLSWELHWLRMIILQVGW